MHPFLKKTARDIMSVHVVTASPATTGEVLVRQLLCGQFSGLPVVDENQTVVGVVTEFDLLKAIRAGKNLANTTAREIMTIPPICVSAGTPVEQVLQKMIDYFIIRLPVVENEKLIGIIARPNILRQVVDTDSLHLRILSYCYWCEKVKDDFVSTEGQEVWCKLPEYLERHHLHSSEVTFLHVFCPECAPSVKKLEGEQREKSFES